jgi:hypothetical protein
LAELGLEEPALVPVAQLERAAGAQVLVEAAEAGRPLPAEEAQVQVLVARSRVEPARSPVGQQAVVVSRLAGLASEQGGVAAGQQARPEALGAE